MKKVYIVEIGSINGGSITYKLHAETDAEARKKARALHLKRGRTIRPEDHIMICYSYYETWKKDNKQ